MDGYGCGRELPPKSQILSLPSKESGRLGNKEGVGVDQPEEVC